MMAQESRQAILFRLISLLGDSGKTRLQKLAYFLQESYGVPLGYRFVMHYYGPYSFELDDELRRMDALGYIAIERDPDGYGFHVRAKGEGESTWEPVLKERDELACRVSEDLGKEDLDQLELLATAHFVARIVGEHNEQQALASIRALKPRFSEDEILEALRRTHSLASAG